MTNKNLIFLALLAAIYGRFLGIAGLDFSTHLKTLDAFFYSSERQIIFLIQFTGFLYVFTRAISVKEIRIEPFIVAILLLTLVSVVRRIIPIFLISIVGDIFIIFIMKRWLSDNIPTDNDG